MPAENKRDLVLDFWRGASILMVLLQHLAYYHYPIFRQFTETASYTGSLLHNVLLAGDHVVVAAAYRSGDLGVRFFFVISGYIITLLLLREEAKSGRISAWAFYFRRICRILPAYFAYLLFLCTCAWAGWTVLDFGQVPYAAAFLCNTDLLNCGWNLGHTWTLAIEEQFYILWPLFLIFIPKKMRVPAVVLTIGILLCLSINGILVAHTWTDNALCFACILLGALYAISAPFRKFVQRWGVWAAAALFAAILLADKPLHLAAAAHVAFREATPFFILVCIVATYRLGWLIRSRFFLYMTYIGLISYSLYIWQELFTNYPSAYTVPSLLLVTPLMFVFSTASYLFIEKPFIKWGKAFLRREAPSVPITDAGPGI